MKCKNASCKKSIDILRSGYCKECQEFFIRNQRAAEKRRLVKNLTLCFKAEHRQFVPNKKVGRGKDVYNQYLLDIPKRIPMNKGMFLQREYDLIEEYFAKNPQSYVSRCALEIGFGYAWTKVRVYELVKSGVLQVSRKNNSYLFEVI
jgi:hypothetical protein